MEKLQNVNPSLLAAPEHFVRPDTPVMGRRKEIRADSLPSSTHPGDETHLKELPLILAIIYTHKVRLAILQYHREQLNCQRA